MESKWSLDTIFRGKVTCDKCLAFKICVRLSQQLLRVPSSDKEGNHIEIICARTKGEQSMPILNVISINC